MAKANGKNGTVADLVLYLLDNFDPLAKVEVLELEVEVVGVVRVHLPDTNKTSVKPEVFKIIEAGYLSKEDEGRLVFFDYDNPGEGPDTRVGQVMAFNNGGLLLWDISIEEPAPRRFNGRGISNPHFLD